MASSTSAVSVVSPITHSFKRYLVGSSCTLGGVLPLKSASGGSRRVPAGRLEVRVRACASDQMKEKAVAGLTAAAIAATLVVPEIAEAAQPGMSPSLKNFLLSIISGGVVVTVIIGAVLGVANFDPVKRT